MLDTYYYINFIHSRAQNEVARQLSLEQKLISMSVHPAIYLSLYFYNVDVYSEMAQSLYHGCRVIPPSPSLTASLITHAWNRSFLFWTWMVVYPTFKERIACGWHMWLNQCGSHLFLFLFIYFLCVCNQVLLKYKEKASDIGIRRGQKEYPLASVNNEVI